MVDDNKDFNFNDEVRARIEDLNYLIESTVNKSLMSSREALDYIEKSFYSFQKILEPIRTLSDSFKRAFSPIKEVSNYFKAIEVLGENQFVFWEQLENELALELMDAKNIESFMLEYYTKNKSEKLNSNIDYCKSNKLINSYKSLFSQSLSTYKRGEYYISILGLLAISDGLLSEVSNLKTNTNIEKRGQIILKKLEQGEILLKIDYRIMSLYITFEKTLVSIGKFRKFSKNEPNLLNRHWIMHGHSKRKISQIDCIKIINLIYGILFLFELIEE